MNVSAPAISSHLRHEHAQYVPSTHTLRTQRQMKHMRARWCASLAARTDAMGKLASPAASPTTAPPESADVYVLEGAIGAGKTHLCALLAGDGVRVQRELTDDPLRRLFRADPARYAFALQATMQRERALTLRYEVERARTLGHTAAVLDRSVLGDLAFAALNAARGNISADEYAAYTALAGTSVDDVLARALPPCARVLVVYLRSPASACIERQRTRDGFAIEERYMQELVAAHELVMAHARTSARVTLVALEWCEYERLTSAADFFALVHACANGKAPAKDAAATALEPYAGVSDTFLQRLDSLLGK